MKTALAFDIGGTKLAAGIVDLDDMTLVDSVFQPTEREAGAEGTVRDLVAMARGLKGVDGIEAMGVCFGGYARANQVLRNLHVHGWDDFPLRERLQSYFGDHPVYIANDANAVALSEYKFGAGRGARSMLFVTVSTGVGGGLILDGQLHEGSTGIAGEIGHLNAIPEGGPLCNCGRRGCVEAVSAGPSMVKRARGLMETDPALSTTLRNVPALTARDIAVKAAEGDALAIKVLCEGAWVLGIAVGNVINLLDLDRVVIGGGVSRAGALWWDALRGAVENVVLPWRTLVEIKPSELGTHEGLWGAVALLPNANQSENRLSPVR